MSEKAGGQFYKVVCALIILLVVGIRLHLANVPFERDEGEYAYAGQLLNKGIPPYQEVYNMKFPGVYFMYALSFKMFGDGIASARYLVLLLQLTGACFIFLLARRLIDPLAGWLAAAAFMLFNLTLAMQGTQTNTEHFLVAFLVPSLFFLYRGTTEERWVDLAISGFLLAVACLMKQHAFIFTLVGIPWIVYIRGAKSVKYLIAFAAGGVVPAVLMGTYLCSAGVWDRFYFLTVQYSQAYINVVPTINTNPAQGTPGSFNFNVLSPLLVWFGLVCSVGLFVPRIEVKNRLFVILLFIASAISVCPGFYFRRHYFLMTLPLLSLLFTCTAFAFANYFPTQRRILALSLFFCVNVVFFVCYDYAAFFIKTPEQISQQMYAGTPFPVSGKVATYIQQHSLPGDRICMVGSEPQLFFLSQRRSTTGYIYIYPLIENQKYRDSMTNEFINRNEQTEPAILVYSSFSIFDPNYTEQSRLLNWFNRFKSNYTLKAIYVAKEGADESLGQLDTIAPMDTFSLRAPQIRVYRRIQNGNTALYRNRIR